MLARILYDPRDVVFVRLLGECACVAIAGLSLFVLPWSWWVAAAYLLIWAFGFLDRFTLMLHCVSHRVLFKPKWMRQLVPWVIGPFFGQTPHSYGVHHLGMHHIEDNLWDDLSSTQPYQRDRFLHWLHYFGTFLFFGLPLLARYHWRKKSRTMFWRLVVGEGAYWTTMALLLTLNWRATLVVFLIPVFVVRALMMAGNWGQHAFIGTDLPVNGWQASTTCLAERYNRRCFNDGFHLLHHHKPRLHYTEMPAAFEASREEYGRNDAVVFEGVDFFQVWVLLMLGRKRDLARRFVRLPGAPARTDDEVITLLETRLRPIPR